MPFAVEVVDRERNETGLELWRLSVDQYLSLASMGFFADSPKVELLDGYVVQKVSKNPAHIFSKRVIAKLLAAQLPPGWLVGQEDSVRIGGSSVPEPDVMVLSGDERTYVHRLPEAEDLALVVEVANTSLHRDKTWKAEIYARAGIPHFWLVNLPESCLELYSSPRESRYEKVTRLTRGEEATVTLEPGPIRVPANDVLPSAE